MNYFLNVLFHYNNIWTLVGCYFYLQPTVVERGSFLQSLKRGVSPIMPEIVSLLSNNSTSYSMLFLFFASLVYYIWFLNDSSSRMMSVLVHAVWWANSLLALLLLLLSSSFNSPQSCTRNWQYGLSLAFFPLDYGYKMFTASSLYKHYMKPDNFEQWNMFK